MSEIYLYNHNIHKHADFNVWLAFPGPESFALSTLGYLWLYKQLDENEDINVERLYADTIKTTINKNDVDVIAFSLSFDMDIFTALSMLKKYKIPQLTAERDENQPLLYAGGPVITANPEPFKNFFDFFVIGDGDELNLEIIKVCKGNKDKNKDELLKILAEIDGVYVPKYSNVVKKITSKLAKCVYTPIISDKSFFPNTFIIEVERGCANRCGFCLASYLNLPIRFLSYDEIISTIELGLKYTNKLALLGAQITAHPQFKEICKYIYEKISSGKEISLSISSMRIDAFCPEVVKTLVAAGQKNTTLAIEAGSERLRRVINKNLTEHQIFNAIDIAVSNGLKGLKFYGMIGLPTETQNDLDEMVQLATKIKKSYKGFDISFGFSTFVPKANTPFQWIGREDTKILERKIEYLRKELHKIGVKAQFSSPKWDYYQAVLSRGDDKLTDYILNLSNDEQTLGNMKKYAKNLLDLDHYALKTYNYTEKLPWDFIEIKPGKEFLIEESKRLLIKENNI